MMRMRAWIRPRLHRRSINLIRRVNKCEEAYGRKNDTAQLVKELAEAAGTSGKVAKLVLEKDAVIAVRETRKAVCLCFRASGAWYEWSGRRGRAAILRRVRR
jgi:hypothetical protein